MPREIFDEHSSDDDVTWGYIPEIHGTHLLKKPYNSDDDMGTRKRNTPDEQSRITRRLLNIPYRSNIRSSKGISGISNAIIIFNRLYCIKCTCR